MKSVKDCWLVGWKVLNLKTTVCCNGQVALVFAVMQLHVDRNICIVIIDLVHFFVCIFFESGMNKLDGMVDVTDSL